VENFFIQEDAMRSNRNKPVVAINNLAVEMLTDDQVEVMVPALQRQVTEHFEPAWGIGAELVFVPRKRKPPRHAYRIDVKDKAQPEDAGYFGYHFQEDGYPIASIFADVDLKDDGTISDTMSHEILEMLVDPAVNLYAYRPASGDIPDRGYFYEVCDPVQCVHYKIDGVKVTNFVYPSWYEYVWPRGSRKFDHLGKIKEPFEILKGCYADVREPGEWKTIWGSDKQERKRHRGEIRKKQKH
jgi:hypothetical protein